VRRYNCKSNGEPMATAGRFDEPEPTAILRSYAVGSQDESPCRAIHKDKGKNNSSD